MRQRSSQHIAEAGELYDVASWGKGYFSVADNGHVLVHPEKDVARSIDLKRFPTRLRSLKPHEIEDVLCIYKEWLASARHR